MHVLSTWTLLKGKIFLHLSQRGHLLLAQLSKEKFLCLEAFAHFFVREIHVKCMIQKSTCGVAFLVMLHLEAMQVLQILLMGKYLLMAFLEMSYEEEEGSFSCTMLRKTNGNPFENTYFILAGMKLLLYEFQEMSWLIAGKFQIDTWRG